MASICYTTATLILTGTTMVETVIRTTTTKVVQESGSVETIQYTYTPPPRPAPSCSGPACPWYTPAPSVVFSSIFRPGRTTTLYVPMETTGQIGQVILNTQYATTCTQEPVTPKTSDPTSMTTTATYTSDASTITTTFATLINATSVAVTQPTPNIVRRPGTIAGVVVGGLMAIAVLLALLVYYFKIFKKEPTAAKENNEKGYHYVKASHGQTQGTPNGATAYDSQSTHSQGPQFTQGQSEQAIPYANPQGQQMQSLQPHGQGPQYVGMQGVDYSAPSNTGLLPPGAAAAAVMVYPMNRSSTSASSISGPSTTEQGSYTSTLPFTGHASSSHQQQVLQNAPFSVPYGMYPVD